MRDAENPTIERLFSYLRFLSLTFTILKTVREGGDYLVNCCLLLSSNTTSQALINRLITAENSPLELASSWTGTGNVWFPSAIPKPVSYAPLKAS